MRKFKTFTHRLIFSFPIQLLILHFKKNQIQLLYWLLLFSIVSGAFLTRYGLPYLFVDPEYMGNVSATAFFIVGLSFGTFAMAFNISSYLLNAHRFPFLATLSRTFFKYCLNNFILPTVFLIVYLYQIINFQYFEELRPLGQVTTFVFAFFAGYGVVVYLVFRYFRIINKDIYKMYDLQTADDDDVRSPLIYSFREGKLNYDTKEHPYTWHVETYLASFTKARIVRDVSHYPVTKLQSVFKQNHINAAVFEMILFLAFFSIGLFSDHDLFKIPAAASLILLLAMFIMLVGVVRFWLKSWATTVLILFFFLLNFLSQFHFFNRDNVAYGLNYDTKKQTYDLPTINAYASSKMYNEDMQATISILEKWKQKWAAKGVEKPKIILLNISGGGVRSMLYTFKTMLMIDSTLNGNLMDQTFLISGSSGGMISASYYRQLFLENSSTLKMTSGQTDTYLNNMGKDMLNGIAFKLTVSDLFLNFQKFDDGKYSYIKDRGYAWEEQLNSNLENKINKRLSYYVAPEKEAKIPLMFITPTIINDGRVLYISPQNISYMLQSKAGPYGDSTTLVNGVEYCRYFAEQDALNTRMTSVLRMNSSFPWISPVVALPSEPSIESMDSGIRDNFGLMTSMRFLIVFKKWIKENTGGVVVLQIRDTYKNSKMHDSSVKTIYDKLATPFRNVSGNFLLMQDYNNDAYTEGVRAIYDGQINFVSFQLPDGNGDQRASLSWHLTKKEKEFIKRQPYNAENLKELAKLKALLPN